MSRSTTIQRRFQLVFAFPFTVLYALAITTINALYRWGVLRGIRYDVPIITVGNLSVGGTGKTPHVEYLLREISPYLHVAALSRGYKRQTKGYLSVQPHHTALEVGDEPLQFKRKFPEVQVAVAESRVDGVSQIMAAAPHTQLIVLDDGYQHRALVVNYSILLTTYDAPYFSDYLLPGGTLREWRSGARRASVIVVTKCPAVLPEAVRAEYLARLRPLSHQEVYFSYYQYGTPYAFLHPQNELPLTDDLSVLVVAGLASSDYLVSYLDGMVGLARILDYPDHHAYREKDIETILAQYEAMPQRQKVILTTEKDATRLQAYRDTFIAQDVPVFVLPVTVAFHPTTPGQPALMDHVKSFLLSFKA